MVVVELDPVELDPFVPRCLRRCFLPVVCVVSFVVEEVVALPLLFFLVFVEV